MQELGRDGVARLFFNEFCKGHPEVLQPAWDNIGLIKRHTLGVSRWTRMTEYRKTFTRDKFIDIFRFIQLLQEKCGDRNDTFGVVKKINRQDIMNKKFVKKSSVVVDEVQTFDDGNEGGDSSSSRRQSPSKASRAAAASTDKAKKHSDKPSLKPAAKAEKGGGHRKKSVRAEQVLPIDDFD